MKGLIIAEMMDNYTAKSATCVKGTFFKTHIKHTFNTWLTLKLSDSFIKVTRICIFLKDII